MTERLLARAAPEAGTEVLVGSPSRTMWKVGRGIPLMKWGYCLKKREGCWAGTIQMFLCFFFSWENQDSTITCPKPCGCYMMSPDLSYPKTSVHCTVLPAGSTSWLYRWEIWDPEKVVQSLIDYVTLGNFVILLFACKISKTRLTLLNDFKD